MAIQACPELDLYIRASIKRQLKELILSVFRVLKDLIYLAIIVSFPALMFGHEYLKIIEHTSI